MIDVVDKDIIDIKADIKINTINCVGAMGKGLAYQFKQQYPEMYQAYKTACLNKQVQIGHMWRWKDEQSGQVIVNFPTKDDWRNPSQITYIIEGLRALKAHLRHFGQPGMTIAIPALGCECGGLEWENILPLIRDYLEDLPFNIIITKPMNADNKMMDITQQSMALDNIAKQTRRCNKCPLCETRTKTVPGRGKPNAVVMFIGEGPGKDEDSQGLPFVGKCGKYFTQTLKDTGGKGEWCYITNVVACRPPNNRNPDPEEIMACADRLSAQMEAIKPRIIVCVGLVAAQTILNGEYGDKLFQLRGQWFVKNWFGTNWPIIRVIYHPSYLLQYKPADKIQQTEDDLKEVWKKAARYAEEVK